MTPAEKRAAIASEQKRIDALPYTPLIPYVFCCICFEKLTEHNIVEKDDHLVDVCLECEDK